MCTGRYTPGPLALLTAPFYLAVTPERVRYIILIIFTAVTIKSAPHFLLTRPTPAILSLTTPVVNTLLVVLKRLPPTFNADVRA